MRPWQYVDHEAMPDTEETLYLLVRGSEYSIRIDGWELMGNREHGSEAALADFACDRLARLDDARVLVGGLGMGFTLAATLDRIGPSASTTVAELMPSVVRWNRKYVGRAAGHPLRDPRVEVYLGDVGDLIEKPPEAWSAILLDVDNGPRALSRDYNRWLYTLDGLHTAHDALIPGGILGIWSAEPDAVLTNRLRETGFEVEELSFTEGRRATPDDTGTHALWMARRPARTSRNSWGESPQAPTATCATRATPGPRPLTSSRP